MAALSAMVNLEIPHVNVMTKMDLVAEHHRQIELESYLDPDPKYILEL